MERNSPRQVCQSAMKRRGFAVGVKGHIDTFRRRQHIAVVDYRECLIVILNPQGGRILHYDGEELNGTEIMQFIMERLNDT